MSFSINYVDYNLIYSPSGSTVSLVKYSGLPQNLILDSTITKGSNTYTLVNIGVDAFNRCKSLTNVIIPSSVTYIDENAFVECINLTSINIPSSVKNIGNYAFEFCSNLVNIIVNSYISNFGLGFFSVNNIGLEITFNYNGRIPNGACNGRSNMTNVVIGPNITGIDEGAFSSCSSLKNINIPNSVINIEAYAFEFCGGLTTIIIPSSVTKIGESAFQSCTSLISINIPSLITNINTSVFEDCSGLTSIIIPSSVTSIDINAFKNCNSLKNVTFNGDIPIINSTGNFTVSDDTAYYITSATNVSRLIPFFTNIVEGLPGDFSAPQNVTVKAGNKTAIISWSAVTVSDSITITKYQISYYNTANPSSVTRVDVNGNITEKEITGFTNDQTYGFSIKAYSGDYVSLASSTVTATPFAIAKPEGNNATASINSATVSWLPVSVPSPNTITKYQISYFDTSTSSSVTTVDVSGNITEKIINELTPFQTYVFRIKAYVNSLSGEVSDDNATTTPYLLLDSLVYMYNPSNPSDGLVVQNNDLPPSNWDLLIPSTVTYNSITYNVKKINTNALQNVANLKNLTIPNSVTEIGSSAFQGSGLTNVVSWGGITKINIFAFAETALKNITFPNNRNITVQWPGLGSDIFSGCASLTGVTYGNMITELGDRMFKDCSSLTTFTNYSGLTAIRSRVFYNCNLKQEFIIPDYVNVLDSGALGLSGITKVTIGTGITYIPDYAFESRNGDNELTIAIFKGNIIPTISSIGNFNNLSGDSAYYYKGAFNTNILPAFFNYVNSIDSSECVLKCDKNKWDKFKFTSVGNNPNISYKQQLSIKIKTTVGGSVQYGNYYLGKPIQVNYLGRTQGQPGGSGAPLRNKF